MRKSTEARNIRKTFGENLRRMRQEYGYSERRFAREVGIPTSSLTYYEHNWRLPTIEVLLDICDTLDTTPNELLEYK